MKTQSIDSIIYFQTSINDFNRKAWVYFLKINLETFSKFKEFKAMVEKQSGKYVKFLK